MIEKYRTAGAVRRASPRRTVNAAATTAATTAAAAAPRKRDGACRRGAPPG